MTDCETVWAIKDESIVSTFVDAGAAKFFLPSLSNEATPAEGPSKRPRYTLSGLTCVFVCDLVAHAV